MQCKEKYRPIITMIETEHTEKVPDPFFIHLAPDTWKILSTLQRTGWVRYGIKNPETVAEHILRLRELGFLYKNINTESQNDLIAMLEVHDWPEAIHGDEVIISKDIQEREKLLLVKFESENKAMTSICSTLGKQGEIIMNLWIRFETSDDAVAKLARQIDKYQAIEKALEYEKTQGVPVFKEFLENARSYIYNPLLLERVAHLEEGYLLYLKT